MDCTIGCCETRHWLPGMLTKSAMSSEKWYSRSALRMGVDVLVLNETLYISLKQL